MINKSKVKEIMPTLEIEKRKSTFEEVELGFNKESAINEALRCLNCKNSPCKNGCPVGVDIPKFINFIANNDVDSAYKTILKENLLPAICGRVCPQEKQCEKNCIRVKTGQSVAIGALERFVADNASLKINNKNFKSNGKKVAIVGSGPSGLTCAGELCKKGYEVHIFEALHTPGGVLAYGIPAFRLPRKILNQEIKNLESLGVKIHSNIVIGKTLYLKDLFNKGFNAVYIASGAGLPKFMDIPGEGLSGVFSANEFLTRINLMKAYEIQYDTPLKKTKTLAVIGGGNVAMDVARSAVRAGFEKVYVIYRKTEEEMPARKAEIDHAKEEGVEFIFLKTPLKFCGKDGVLSSVKCANVKKYENKEEKKFEFDKNDISEIKIDSAVIAVGNSANKILSENEKDLKMAENGCILADNVTARTSKKYVYAGGDVVTGAATVILAMQAGKRAAIQIDKDLF